MSSQKRSSGDGLLDKIQKAIDDAAAGIPSDIQVDTFALLPVLTAGDVDAVRYVRTETGSYILFTKKKRGLYRWTGTAWEYAGDNSRASIDAFYDNTTSGLVAVNAQDAIDEVEARVDTLEANLDDPFSHGFSRDKANTTNIWLDRSGGTACNVTPVRVPFDATIVAVSGTCNVIDTFTLEVYRNTDVRSGGTPLAINALATLAFTASKSESSTVAIDISSGDEIGIFCRGTTVNRPGFNIYLIRR